MYTTTWIDLKEIMLGEKKLFQQMIDCVVLLTQYSQDDERVEMDDGLVIARGWGWGKGK